MVRSSTLSIPVGWQTTFSNEDQFVDQQRLFPGTMDFNHARHWQLSATPSVSMLCYCSNVIGQQARFSREAHSKTSASSAPESPTS